MHTARKANIFHVALVTADGEKFKRKNVSSQRKFLGNKSTSFSQWPRLWPSAATQQWRDAQHVRERAELYTANT